MNANWNILSLTFNSSAGAFTLGSTGSFTLTIQGSGIANNSSSAETINNAITLGAAQTWNAASGNLTFGGNLNNNNQNLIVTGANNTAIGGIISGNGTLTKNGTGTLTLSGANTYGAATTINAGVVNIQNNTAFGASNQTVTVANGAAVQIQNNLTGVANNITISGNGISNDGALRNISGSNTVSGNITLNANSYIGADAGTLTLGGTIGGGANGVTIVGNGTVVFSGAGDNNYSGTTEVKSGTLLLSKSAGHKAVSGPLTIDTGALVQYGGASEAGVAVTLNGTGHLDLNGFNETNSGGLIFTGGSVTTGSGTLTLGGGAATITSNASSTTATISGNLNLGGSNQTFTVASGTAGTDLSISAAISGMHNLTKAGAGVLNVSGANTYTGKTTISAGTMQFAKEVSLYNDATASWTATNLIVASGATAAFNVGGTGEFTSTDIDTLKALGTASGGFESGSILGLDTTNASGGTFTYSSNIANPNSGSNVLGLTKLGTGTLVLSGTNTYTGATFVSGGVLNIQNASALGTTASGTTVASGATLQLQNNITVGAEALTLNGTGASGQNGALVNVSGTNNYGGLVTLGTASTISSDTGTLNLTNAGTITGSGLGLTLTGSGNGSIASIIGTGSGTLTKTGSGTWTLTGANTYTGGTNINTGTLSLGSSGALGTSGTISFGGGTLQYSASNTTDYSSRFSTAATQAYKIDTNGQNVTLATGLTSSGGTFAKSGTGTLTLTGTNTFSGATTVNGGTLLLAGSGGSALGSTSAITVNSGGTLQLGAVTQINTSATMTLAGGTFAKGNFSAGTVGTIGIGALTLSASGSAIDFGTGSVGILTFASLNAASFTLTVNNWTGSANMSGNGSTDRLIFDSDQSSNLSNFNFTGYAPGAMEFALVGGFYEVVPLPETGTFLPGALALIVLLGTFPTVRRRRQEERVARAARKRSTTF